MKYVLPRSPLKELKEVRTHPALSGRPVILAVPGYRMQPCDWRAIDVWPITATGFVALDELIYRIGRLLARAHHPSMAPGSKHGALTRAS